MANAEEQGRRGAEEMREKAGGLIDSVERDFGIKHNVRESKKQRSTQI